MEQISKLIPKQRRPVENYQQPFPISEPEVLITDEVIDKMLESIDETLGTEA